MSTSRAKRQFAGAAADPAQRQITSFFSSSTLGAAPAASIAVQSSRPVLPAETQSNLLNVGMRVRKSVPEGYKTGTYSAFSLFDEADHRHGPSGSKSHISSATATPSSIRNASSQRELLPFCGINKIGGLSFPSPEEQSQPSFTFSAVPSLDDVPSLSSSQDSITSTVSSSDDAHTHVSANIAVLSRKRGHTGDGYGNGEDDDDSDTPSVSDCLQVPSGEWMDGQVSPRSLVPQGSGWENTRVMALPKKIRRSLGLATVPSVAAGGAAGLHGNKSALALGQENVAVDGDFPEADFLDYKVLEDDAMEI